jgi:vacuolar-type H+-ATPase subunit F/Vma7
MPEVYVIGRRADVLPFAAAGAEIVEVEDAHGVAEGLRAIERKHEACLVMVSEDLAEEAAAEVARFRSGKKRALVAIPTLREKPGRTLSRVRKLVARSLGVDLLGKGR